MIKFCCDALARAYNVNIFGLIPQLKITYIEETYEDGIEHTTEIYYCPFCGEKLQNLGKTLEELKKEVKQ